MRSDRVLEGASLDRSPCGGFPAVPHALLDDYLGGRTDRLGRDLLFDLRRPSPARPPVANALLLATPFTVRDVLIQVHRRHPDLVWLYPDDLRRARDVARRIIETGVEAIIIDDETFDDDVTCL